MSAVRWVFVVCCVVVVVVRPTVRSIAGYAVAASLLTASPFLRCHSSRTMSDEGTPLPQSEGAAGRHRRSVMYLTSRKILRCKALSVELA